MRREVHPDEQKRKARIIETCKRFSPVGYFERALDLGAGEGFITRDLPAIRVYGLELSDAAASRFPVLVARVVEPEGEYDLVTATDVLYPHYDSGRLLSIIEKHASGLVVVCGIRDLEVPEVARLGTPIHTEEFSCLEDTQRLKVYHVPLG